MKKEMSGNSYISMLLNKIKGNNYSYDASDDELNKLRLLSMHRLSYIRTQVAEVLGYIDNNGKSENILLEMLDDRNWLVRSEAAESLGAKANNEATLAKLIKQIEQDKHVISVTYQINALAEIVIRCEFDKLSYINALEKIKDKHKEYRIKHACISSLCMLGEVGYFSILEKDLKSKKPYVVESALINLRNLAEDELYKNKVALSQKIFEIAETIQFANNEDYWYSNMTKEEILNIAKTKNNG